MRSDGPSDGAKVESQFIASYLSPPQLGLAMIRRERLLASMTQGTSAAVTLISGEPASGKTSLLAQWLASDASRGRTPIWLTVPPDTDDELRFWEYLISAVAAIGAHAPRVDDLWGALRDRQPPTDEWLTALANRLSAPDRHLVLAIDDLQELKAASALTSLGRLLEITHTGVSVLVATRVLPDWPLAEWRMSGRLIEIDSRDLAVTVAETGELLAANGIDVVDDDVKRLVERTEGWIGGVKLATLAIQRSPNPSELIARFSANHELVSTYLLRVVLDRQDDDVQQFLRDVSVLDTMSAELCDEVRQADDSAELLERCRVANIFVSRVGGVTGQYLLHALFRELLRADLEQRCRERFSTLHRRASEAFEATGEHDRAVRHAIAAGDGDRANDLVIAHAPMLAHQARFEELGRWTALLKRSGLTGASTILALATTLVYAGEGTEALRLLDEFAEVPRPPALERFGTLLRAPAHMVRGDVHLLRDLGVQVARNARSLTDEDDDRGPLTGTGLFFQGVGAFLEGELDDASELLALADRPDHRPKPPPYIAVKSWAALVAVRRGDVAGAERCIRAALERRDQLASGDSAAIASALLASAELAWEQNHLNDAAARFNHARRSVPPMPWQAVLVECARSRLTVSQGQPHEALRDLLEISKIVLSNEASPLLRALVAERAVDICLRTGDLDAALGWAHTYERHGSGTLPWATRIRLAHATDPGGSDLIAHALAAEESIPCRIDTLLAAANVTDDEGVALSCVAEALMVAEPGHMIRRFADSGRRVASLTAELESDPRRGGSSEFSRFFAAAVTDACGATSARCAGPPPVVDELVDQLSTREIEVLALLGKGMTYTEIGSELFVSRNTVKSHVQHIYTKLGVAGRDRAIETGRRLGLI